jgi:hypothetical protein
MMIEHLFHDRLAIVEITVDRDRVDIGVLGAGHHPALHIGNAAIRKQHDEIDLRTAAERLDRRSAGVSRGRHRDGGALAADRERMIHQPGEELHRQILEGERRSVKELQQESIGADLRERRHGGMTECPIGFTRHPSEIGFGDRAADERTHDLDRNLRIGPAREARDGLAIESRPRFGHVKAAIAGEPRERDLHKAERRGFAPGRDVAHQFRPRPQRLGATAPGRSRRPQGGINH